MATSREAQNQQAAAANAALEAAAPAAPRRGDWTKTAVTIAEVGGVLLGTAALVAACADYPGVSTRVDVGKTPGAGPGGGGAQPTQGPENPTATATLTTEQQLSATEEHVLQVWNNHIKDPKTDSELSTADAKLLSTLETLHDAPKPVKVSTYTGANGVTMTEIFLNVYFFGETPAQQIQNYAPNSPKGIPIVSGYMLSCAFFKDGTLYFFKPGVSGGNFIEVTSTDNSANQPHPHITNDQFNRDFSPGLMQVGWSTPATPEDYTKLSNFGFIYPADKFNLAQWLMGIKGSQQPDSDVISTDPSAVTTSFTTGEVAHFYS